MPKTIKTRWSVLSALTVIVAVATGGLLASDSNARSAPLWQPAVSPVPSATSVPTTSVAPLPLATATQPAEPSPSTSPSVTAAAPALSAADKEALAYLDFWWDAYTEALSKTDGDKLTAAQVAKPLVMTAKDLSGCPPGYTPPENRLSKAVKAAAMFCNGKAYLVSEKFLALNEFDQMKAVASVFIYHALDNTKKGWRNTAQVLGCLQASLSYAVERAHVAQIEQVWVVMSEERNGGDVFNSYHATYDFNGEWK